MEDEKEKMDDSRSPMPLMRCQEFSWREALEAPPAPLSVGAMPRYANRLSHSSWRSSSSGHGRLESALGERVCVLRV